MVGMWRSLRGQSEDGAFIIVCWGGERGAIAREVYGLRVSQFKGVCVAISVQGGNGGQMDVYRMRDREVVGGYQEGNDKEYEEYELPFGFSRIPLGAVVLDCLVVLGVTKTQYSH